MIGPDIDARLWGKPATRRVRTLLIELLAAIWTFSDAGLTMAEPTSFREGLRPILAAKCFHCQWFSFAWGAVEPEGTSEDRGMDQQRRQNQTYRLGSVEVLPTGAEISGRFADCRLELPTFMYAERMTTPLDRDSYRRSWLRFDCRFHANSTTGSWFVACIWI